MGREDSWPIDRKIELWELVTKNQKEGTKILSIKQAWEFKTKYPQLTQNAILGMARKLLRYTTVNELEKRETQSYITSRWSSSEDEYLLKTAEGIENDEERLTAVFCDLADKLNRSPSAVKKRWLKLTKRNCRLYPAKNTRSEKDKYDEKNYEDLRDEVRWLMLTLRQIGDLVNFSISDNNHKY